MEKSQADAVVQAMLEPDLRAQAEIQLKRSIEAARLARQRRAAWFFLVGACVGAAIAHFSGIRFSLGILWGGLAGSAVGWLATHRAA